MDASFRTGLALALAIHLGLGAVLLLLAPQPQPAARASPSAPVWIDLDQSVPPVDAVSPLPPRTGTSEDPSPSSQRLAAVLPSGVRRVDSSARAGIDAQGAVLNDGTSAPDGIGAPAADSSVQPSDSAPGAGAANGVPSRRRRAIDIGLGRGLNWAVIGPAPSANVPRPLSATGGLQEALDQHDRALGLGFGGPAASAVRSAVSNISAPRAGLALIELVFDGTGKVQSARVLSANDDQAGWARVAADARAALAAARIRVPSQSSGLAVTLQVEARMQLPSGASPGDAVNVHPSGLGAAGQFDLSDIGARPTRNVSVRIVGERRL